MRPLLISTSFIKFEMLTFLFRRKNDATKEDVKVVDFSYAVSDDDYDRLNEESLLSAFPENISADNDIINEIMNERHHIEKHIQYPP